MRACCERLRCTVPFKKKYIEMSFWDALDDVPWAILTHEQFLLLIYKVCLL
jgi:hypothetical protein